MWIQNQTSFKHLDISNASSISDGIPAWFWKLPFLLKFLDLSSNELKGMLPNITPADFHGYPGMDLSNNQLEGRIPLLPSKLSALNLSGNKFSGTLSFLCQIDEELTLLDLSYNSLSGRLPDCWLKFQKGPVVLNLSNNTLSGKIPPPFRFLNQLEALYLRSNTFSGELPIALSNCTKLRFVDFGENKLSGIIPTWIGERLSNLSFLVLQSNRFCGQLPSQLCWLNNLQVLHLSNNGFSGNIPRCFDNFTAMAYNLTFGTDIINHPYDSYHPPSYPSFVSRRRRLSDRIQKIPYDAIKQTNLPFEDNSDNFEEAVFIDNALIAWKETTREFGKGLKLLKIIDLSNNKLSGELPDEVTGLHGLVSLNLSRNKLAGEIPKQMGQMKSLNSLDLSRNEFSGDIPSSLSEISFLGYLDLSNNNLSGRIPSGTQLQGFNSSSYTGNPYLYGPPLTPGRRGLPGPPAIVVVGKEDGSDDWNSFYTGMGAGFAVGFWGICGALFLNRRCRYFFFAFLIYVKDLIYVTMVVHFRKLQRIFTRS